jgi:predicted Rossmann fold nucleotide-binding protein DprA/Smf involved in DNA uptake
MFGMDLFFKSTATGIKIAQIWMTNMVKMIELFAGVSCQTKKPAKKEARVVKKTTHPPQPPSVAKVEKQVSQKTVTASNVQSEPSSKDMRNSSTQPASSKKTIPGKSDNKTEKKPVAPQKSSSSKKKPSTAIGEVQAFMKLQKQGVSTEDIMKATGFKKKRVQDILYKLKKRGILKSERGIYIHV